jgi:hypothetical protein
MLNGSAPPEPPIENPPIEEPPIVELPPPSIPTLNSEGAETSLPYTELEKMEKMLMAMGIAFVSFDTNHDIPREIIGAPLYDHFYDGILSKAEAEKILSEFWGREIKDVHEEAKDLLIDYNRDKQQYEVYAFSPHSYFETMINNVYDLGNGYYKVLGLAKYYDSIFDENYDPKNILIREDNLTAIFKVDDTSRFGYNLVAQKYELIAKYE